MKILYGRMVGIVSVICLWRLWRRNGITAEWASERMSDESHKLVNWKHLCQSWHRCNINWFQGNYRQDRKADWGGYYSRFHISDAACEWHYSTYLRTKHHIPKKHTFNIEKWAMEIRWRPTTRNDICVIIKWRSRSWINNNCFIVLLFVLIIIILTNFTNHMIIFVHVCRHSCVTSKLHNICQNSVSYCYDNAFGRKVLFS